MRRVGVALIGALAGDEIGRSRARQRRRDPSAEVHFTLAPKASGGHTARAMSEENVKLARRSLESLNESGVEGSRRVGWTDDVEFHDPSGFPDADVHRGADAVASRLEELRSLLPHRLEVLEASAVSDDEVLLVFQVHGSGGSSGVPVEQPMGLLMRIENGKVSRWRPFMSQEDAREAAGRE
jgi:ketosteroid isomerase-like protein